jgi:hypothetical protein
MSLALQILRSNCRSGGRRYGATAAAAQRTVKPDRVCAVADPAAQLLVPWLDHHLILLVAQVIIGVSIGTQYRHEFLTRLLRLLLASLVPFALLATGLVASPMRCC